MHGLSVYSHPSLWRIVLLLSLAYFLDCPSLSPCPPVTQKQSMSSRQMRRIVLETCEFIDAASQLWPASHLGASVSAFRFGI